LFVPAAESGEFMNEEDVVGPWAILFTSYPLSFGLVICSGVLSVLVRWLTRREKCLLE